MYNSTINRTKLPNPLSDEQFNYHYNNFLEGDYKSLEILVLHNLRLIYWYIDKNINCEELEYDEIFSVGIEALIESFYSFNNKNGAKFSTYATICIRNKILKYFRNENKHNKNLSLDRYITDSNNSDTFGELVAEDNLNQENSLITMEEELEEKDTNEYYKRHISAILNNLNSVDQEIIKLSFGFYDRIYVQREICQKLGLSQSQVSKRLSKTLKYIKENLENDKTISLDTKIITLTKKAS